MELVEEGARRRGRGGLEERNIAGLLPGLRELLGREATNQRRSEGNGPNR
ncbi:MAG: hypothetical protein R5N68_06730 [Cutibacterium granulosum]|nr:hypothetical protein [Cutibacterium granulosum]